ncbi:ABC transporter permease [Hypericibacter adhaerens]|uniref:ABC transporter permease n=1 Tax=Hypericibacter adhaerens TaxID=2602016 RepID=A0A5J6N6F1_9PROT|nr:ABC transporter permease [Hypericibacter adhaerens]QEX24313.1 ABC transporter permease [Hypericibacter adhaerens]
MIARGRIEPLLLGGITGLLLLIMLSPILTVVVMSLTDGSTLQFPPPGFSLRWYRSAWELLADPADTGRFREALVTSLAISLTVMILASAAGIPAAYALVRHRFRGKPLVEILVTLPLVFPLVVLGISFLVIVSELGIEQGFLRIVVAHVILVLPFVVRNCVASLTALPLSHEEAARVLGANWWRSLMEIVLPTMKPGIVAGMLLAFIVSFNEFTVAYFLYTIDVFPLPVWLFSRSNTSLDPTIFALSSGVILLDFILIWILDRLVGRQGVTL